MTIPPPPPKLRRRVSPPKQTPRFPLPNGTVLHFRAFLHDPEGEAHRRPARGERERHPDCSGKSFTYMQPPFVTFRSSRSMRPGGAALVTLNGGLAVSTPTLLPPSMELGIVGSRVTFSIACAAALCDTRNSVRRLCVMDLVLYFETVSGLVL